MKTSIPAVFVTTVLVSLFLSVSYDEGAPAVTFGGEEACADTTSCHVACESQMEACVKGVKKETKVGACFECCKETEKEGRAGINFRPTRDELHQFMLDKCVFGGLVSPALTRDFPRDLHAAEAFEPKRGKIAEAVEKRFPKQGTSEPDMAKGPKNASESACMKGCSYRTKPGMDYCHHALTMCLARCPAPSGTSACGKR